MESMDYFYKQFYSELVTCKFTICNATIFLGLEKHANNIKYSRKHMAAMCIIKTYFPQRFSYLWNE